MNLPCKNPEIFIAGPVGRLEAIVGCTRATPSAVAVICHPHPLHGGTMQNKVVHTLARTLTSLGVACLRFNFRGVGNSDGQFDNGAGEADDCIAAARWLVARVPDVPLWLAGFSFGGGVALRAAAHLQPAQLVLVAPSVTLHGFGELAATVPMLLVQGENDEIVPPEAVRAWQKTNAPQAHYVGLPGVGHFFHGALTDLKTVLSESLGLPR